MSLSRSEPIAGILPPGAPMLRAPALSSPVRVPGGWWPLLVLGLGFCVWTLLHGDVWLADRVYAWQGHAWTLRDAAVPQQLIHLLGRDLSALAWLVVFAVWLVAGRRVDLAPLRKPLLYLLVATALSSVLVAWIKSWSNVDCPWDLVRYGGTRPYTGLFAPRPAGLERGVCFPAGHAGAGYAWLALYFFLLVVKPKWRWLGLVIGVGAGLLFGISQQLRGAHFLSHDMASVAICWTCATALHAAFWRGARAPRPGAPRPAAPESDRGASGA